ncbi:MAG: hypothetical protein J6M02_00365 [Clostridia bacterium]|nr:hypothetical protein [Clostridia bacterium]
MKVFLIVVMGLSFLATCFMQNKTIPGVIGLIAVVIFIKTLLNEIADLREEEERSIEKIDEELYEKNDKKEEISE